MPRCNGCPKINHCKVRAQEWLRNIDKIMSPPNGERRDPGEGQNMAEEVVNYMQEEFEPEECERKK